MSAHQEEVRATETPEQRETRLQQMSAHRREVLTAETAETRDVRLQVDRERHRQRRSANPGIPLLDQPAVQTKMQKFHTSLATLEVSTCSTCLEGFPGLTMCSQSNECKRCSNDTTLTPKLFAHANNMDPGPVPSQLQVCCPHMYKNTLSIV